MLFIKFKKIIGKISNGESKDFSLEKKYIVVLLQFILASFTRYISFL